MPMKCLESFSASSTKPTKIDMTTANLTLTEDNLFRLYLEDDTRMEEICTLINRVYIESESKSHTKKVQKGIAEKLINIPNWIGLMEDLSQSEDIIKETSIVVTLVFKVLKDLQKKRKKGRSGSSSDERGLSSWDFEFLKALDLLVDEEVLARIDESKERVISC
ncbi:uncharacterized protein LOC134820561 [Bolinopsis microptera]|uniref:uncharacterized protein LOC134820561 n=1 Tax=Bolinopsis microptera TaxID=2820187 RepID=UPI003079EF2B